MHATCDKSAAMQVYRTIQLGCLSKTSWRDPPLRPGPGAYCCNGLEPRHAKPAESRPGVLDGRATRQLLPPDPLLPEQKSPLELASSAVQAIWLHTHP